jgi:hypothetical protein
MVVGKVCQLARGITSAYNLWLRKYLLRWKGINVYNNINGIGAMIKKKMPQNIPFYASKWN